jgi:cytochrome b6-f complex iron-sulfur subunit
MADPKKMSIQEMLAAARASAGGGSKPEKEPAEEAPAAAPKAEAKKAPAAKAGGSVADILAAARAADAGGGGKPASEAAGDNGDESGAPTKPVAKPASGKGMSVADMLAAARGEKSGAAAAPKEKAAPAAKKAAAEPKAKAAPKSPAAEKAAGARDTQSILAAARKSEKAGPMSKAEAAQGDADKPSKPAKGPKVAPPMPEKPAYARPAPASKRAADQEDRRGFFGLLLGSYLAVGFTTLGLTNLLWTLGFARFMFPNILTEPPTRFKVGPPSNFAPGQVETKFVAQFGVWVVNTVYQGAQIIFALRTVCTHLGCTPNWLEAEQKFKCPCHGSGFYKDGINFEGPAPRPLERYAISVAADGQLEIDKSKLFQEEKGQWSDPASKVPV